LDVFRGYEDAGSMPTMQFVYLPSDHTWSTTQDARKPSAYVADNDLAMGKLVDAVSHSQFWGSTAIFAVEDDAQDGPDHVDAHRSTAFVISPYTQTGKVDSTFYSSVSVLRTIELILGLHPLTQFDAAATPMLASFTDHPNLAPYTAIVRVDDPGDAFYVILDGSAAVRRTGKRSVKLQRGDFFGELALLDGAAPSVSPPGSPADGQIWYYPPSGGGAAWQFRYNSAGAAPNLWEFVGGPPIAPGPSWEPPEART
jgi:hypothetical protein